MRSKPTHLGAFAVFSLCCAGPRDSEQLRRDAGRGADLGGHRGAFGAHKRLECARPSASAAHICRSHTFRPSTAVFKQGRKGQVAKGGCRQQKQTREHQKGRSWGKCGRAGGIISAGRQQQQQQRASTARGEVTAATQAEHHSPTVSWLETTISASDARRAHAHECGLDTLAGAVALQALVH